MRERTPRLACHLLLAFGLLGYGCAPVDDEEVSADTSSLSSGFSEDYENDVEDDVEEAKAEERIAALDTAKREGPLSILQDDAYFDAWDDAKSKAHNAEAREMGADVIRTNISWQSVVPAGLSPKGTTRPKFDATDPSKYDWSSVDRRFDNARAAGLKVLVTITSPIPYWASEEPEHCLDKTWCSWKPKAREYADFMTAVGRHFKRKDVWAWTLWNEPNLGFFLADGGDPANPNDNRVAEGMRYRAMFFHGTKALRRTAGLGDARIFWGDFANGVYTPSHWSIMHYALCLPNPQDGTTPPCPARPRKVQASGVAFHPYAPIAKSVASSVDTFIGYLDAAARAGRIAADRPVYLTEHAFLVRGLVTPAPSVGLSGPGNVITPEEQAVYDNRVDHAMFDRPRVRSIAQFLLVDEGDGKWDSGLRYNDIINPNNPRRLEAKPAWYAYRIGIDVTKVDAKTLKVWGHARACRGAFVVEGLSANGWTARATLTTNALGYAEKTFSSDGATWWRLRCVSAPDIVSREAHERDPW